MTDYAELRAHEREADITEVGWRALAFLIHGGKVSELLDRVNSAIRDHENVPARPEWDGGPECQ
jgi:hypothetical protein